MYSFLATGISNGNLFIPKQIMSTLNFKNYENNGFILAVAISFLAA